MANRSVRFVVSADIYLLEKCAASAQTYASMSLPDMPVIQTSEADRPGHLP
jgi:hypothetical protein